MTKAQKKLQAEMAGIGWRQVEKQTGISSNSLYAYIRSEERCMSMKMSTARKFLGLYNIQFSEWWEEYEDTYGVNIPRGSQSTDPSQRFFEPK